MFAFVSNLVYIKNIVVKWEEIKVATNQRDLEYLIGVIQGDGNVRKKENVVRIFISEKETEFINIIREMAIETFGISPRIYYQKDNSLIVLNFRSKELTNLISQYKDSTTGLWSIPKKLKYPEEWIAGIWDTDGYAKFENGRLECIFTQKSNDNVKFVESALEEIGITRYNISTFEDDRWQELTETDYLRIWNIDTEIFANKINLRFPKKRKALEEALVHNNFSTYRPRGDFKKEIMELIKNKTGLSNKEIAKKLNSSGSQATMKLARLFEEGELSKKKENDRWQLNNNLKIEEW